VTQVLEEAAGDVAAPWITNGTFLWGASAVGILDEAVAAFPGGLITTSEVRSELERHITDRSFLRAAVEAIDAGRVRLTALEAGELKAFARFRSLWQITSADSKNLGEATVIAVATERRIGLVLDDAQARFFVEYNHPDLPLLDTPQVLLHLVDAGVIGDMHRGWELLSAMHDKGGFNHRFARRPKQHWMDRRDYPRRVRL
jgi:predicted nucleic acid-binding protein